MERTWDANAPRKILMYYNHVVEVSINWDDGEGGSSKLLNHGLREEEEDIFVLNTVQLKSWKKTQKLVYWITITFR